MDDKSGRKDAPLDSSYLAWKSRRPQLFLQQSSSSPMATNTVVRITTIADGQERAIALPMTKCDGHLTKSIISRARAAMLGTPSAIPAVILEDANGRKYSSSASITLRWHYEGAAQSFQETFYTVDNCGPYDAVLRKGVQAPNNPNISQAYPLITRKESSADRAARLAREKKRELEVQDQKRQVDQRIRAQVAQANSARRNEKRPS